MSGSLKLWQCRWRDLLDLIASTLNHYSRLTAEHRHGHTDMVIDHHRLDDVNTEVETETCFFLSIVFLRSSQTSRTCSRPKGLAWTVRNIKQRNSFFHSGQLFRIFRSAYTSNTGVPLSFFKHKKKNTRSGLRVASSSRTKKVFRVRIRISSYIAISDC